LISILNSQVRWV